MENKKTEYKVKEEDVKKMIYFFKTELIKKINTDKPCKR